jgi:hypothetical protein
MDGTLMGTNVFDLIVNERIGLLVKMSGEVFWFLTTDNTDCHG